MADNREIITKNAKETQKVGERVARSGQRIVCLYGELGSGKTTFAQGFARGLGITSRLLSPTFIIVRRYEIPSSDNYLYHMDLYRLSEKRQVTDLGIEEIFSDPRAFVLVEWAERLGNLLPAEREDIRFSVLPNGKHTITIT